MTLTTYFVISHQKKKLVVQNQTGEIQAFNSRVKLHEDNGAILEGVVCLPGSTIPVEEPPRNEATQEG